MRQSIDLVTPRGIQYRWSEEDYSPENVPGDLRHSSTMPGGFENCECTLPRKPGVDYSDLERLTTLNIYGAGNEKDGEYRLERAPRVSGDQMAISPSAVGWQAHLEDDKSAREIYVDRDMGRWTEGSLARKAANAGAGSDSAKISASAQTDGLVWDLPNEALPTAAISELFYAAPGGRQIAIFIYQGTRVSPPGTIEGPTLFTGDTDVLGGAVTHTLDLDNTLRTQIITPKRFLMLRAYMTTGATPAAGTQVRYSKIGVYGDHGLTAQTIEDEPGGFLASDVVAHAVATYAPLLNIKSDSIQQSSFVIPHLVFADLTTAAEIVRQASRFNLPDWAVWDDREFVWHERGTRGKNWRARIGPSQLEETGASVERLWEAIMVQYQDVDGGTRTVGPPGSGADTISADLKDDDPENPANKLGMSKRDLLVMGVSTAAGATEVGRRFLEQTKLLDHSGRATFVGWVEDDRGVSYPYSRVRAGDSVAFVDASDPSPRRIIRADHTRSTRSCVVDLDAPPDGLAQLLERLGVVLQPLGL